MSHAMTANFWPAKEPKNGYVGIADVTIANAFEVNSISVFKNRDGNGYHIDFPGFGEGEQKKDYIVPLSAEARAQFVDVIVMAIQDQEHHFGHVTGKQDPYMKVTGKAVQEPYADGRFSVQLDDLCVLHGITTREAKSEKDGQMHVYVNPPQLDPYEKDGQKIYPVAFEALKDGKVYNKEAGKEEHKDFRALMNNLIRAERNKVLNRHPSLDEQVKGAAQKAAQAEAGKEGPAPEHSR